MIRSTVETIRGAAELPDYIYYNADIINNTTADLVNGENFSDPQIRFNETRDAALVKDASQYYFSIIRFTMDGPNKDLPLFIPDIQESTGQTNVNLTSYALSISYQQTWNTSLGPINFNIVPLPRFVQYIPETQNPTLAPLPRPTSAPEFIGVYNPATTYQNDEVVGSGLNVLYGTFSGPFYRVRTPANWNSAIPYAAGSAVMYNGSLYYTAAGAGIGVNPSAGPPWALGITAVAPTTLSIWEPLDDRQGRPQDLSSRYYWVYTYCHWLELVNNTILDPNTITAAVGGTASAAVVPNPAGLGTSCYQDLYNQFALAWAAAGLVAPADPFPFPTLDSFVAFVNPPKIVRDNGSKLFTIKGDSTAFGQRLLTFTPQAYVAGPPAVDGQATPPVMRLFFNTNMYGLFTNFCNTYWNTTDPTIGPFAGLSTWTTPTLNGATNPTPVGYTNEILFQNKAYQNVEDYRLPPFSGVPPLGIVPTLLQKPYWLNEQDYASDDSLWSPISSIVFTSTLLPTRSEQTGPPVILGQGNLGFSSSTAQSAFQPIITDISLPMSSGAHDYRQFIYYAPTAEYRLTDFGTSHQDIRNIDIQVFWKNRLDNNLYPIYMFNQSSVSIKVMFRHKDAMFGKD